MVSSVATAAATQGMLALRGFEPLDLTDPGLIRAVLILVGASMAVQGLIAAGLAVLTRSGVWGLIVAGLISLLPVSFATLLGQWYSEHIPRWLPGAAVESLETKINDVTDTVEDALRDAGEKIHGAVGREEETKH